MTDAKIIFVTDIPFADLKKGHRLEGANGDRGTIAETKVVRYDRIGEEGEHNVVGIRWSEYNAEVEWYEYERLSKVKVVGEPNKESEIVVLSSVEYDEETKTVDDAQFDPDDQFSVDGELLDVSLTEDAPYIAIMSHDVVIVAPFTEDVNTVNNDIFNFIDEKIRINVIVDEDYKLSITSFDLKPQD